MVRILTLLLIAQCAVAQQDVLLSLDDAVILGLEKNYGLSVSDNNIRIAEINDTWAGAGRFLNLDLVATSPQSITRNNRPASFVNGEIYSGAAGIQLQADLPIYQGGQVEVNKKILENNVLIARKQHDLNLSNTIRDIKLQYYSTVLNLASIDVLEQVLAQTENELLYERTRQEYGTSNTFNSVQLESNFLSDSIRLINQASIYRQEALELLQLLSIRSDSARITPLDTLAYRPKIYDYLELKNKLLSQNSDLQQLLLSERESALQLELEKKSKNPQVALNGSLGFTENAFAFLSPPQGFEGGLQYGNESSLGITLSARYNLIDGNRRKRAIESGEVRLDNLQLQKQDLEITLSNELQNLIEQYNNLLDQINIQNKNLVLSKRNIAIGRERFKSGKINSLDFREIQIMYLNAEFSRLNLLHGLKVIETSIEWLTGDYSN